MKSENAFEEITQREKYNPLMVRSDTPLYQGWEFGQWQKAMGRKVRRFAYGDEACFQSVTYPIKGDKTYIYIPHGPICQDKPGEEFWNKFQDKMREIAKEDKAIFVRFDAFLPINNLDSLFTPAPKYSWHGAFFQPPYEWATILDMPEEEILANMHQKTRYNIHLSERKGVEVEIAENLSERFEEFYALLKITAERDKFFLHDKKYYSNVITDGDKNKNAFFILAKYNGKILAMNFVYLFGEYAMYLYGASSNEERNLMPTYLAHWQGMLEAKRRGARYYDFGGYYPEEADRAKWAGFSAFKEKFGGKMIEYGKVYDLIISPLWYKMYIWRKKFRSG